MLLIGYYAHSALRKYFLKLATHTLKIIVFIIGLISFNSQAVEVDNLYTGRILVTDKTQKTRIKAHRWAIEQVITKVSGDREILKNRKIRQTVQTRTANYIKSFTFETDDQGRTFLVDVFDQTKIDQLLKSVGAAIWGQRRPSTIIWLAVEEGVGRSIIDKVQYPQITEFLYQSSENRGLPIKLPEMDDTDKSQVFSSDVWARFAQAVKAGSERYQTENIVMARMRFVNSQKEPEYKTGWLLEYELIDENGSLLTGEFNGEQYSILRSMINQIGDHFAEEYAIHSTSLGDNILELNLTGLENLVSLKQAESYLSSLPPVDTVNLQSISNNKAKFKLSLIGEGLDVIRALALLPEFEQVLIEQEEVKEELNNEQKLELLVQDYLQQVNKNQQAQSETNPEEAAAQVIQLEYKWLGK